MEINTNMLALYYLISYTYYLAVKSKGTEELYMDSFVGRSQDVTVIGERRRKITLFIIICTACIAVAAGIFFLLARSL